MISLASEANDLASPPHDLGQRLADGRMAMVLFSILILVYLLTFSGEFGSIDELAMYATTESLVQIHRFATPQLTFAPFHNRVGLIEPGQSLLAAPLYLLAQQFTRVNNIHAVLLFNVFVTAATGAVLFIILRGLRYRRHIAFIVALGYGMATLAWPYARTFLREPLVALLWTLSMLALILWRQTGRDRYLCLCFLALVLALVTKITSVVAIAGFLLSSALSVPQPKRKRIWIALGTAAFLGTIAGLGILTWRFGSLPSLVDYTICYPLKLSAVRVYGLLFSPAKGLFFFAPALLVAMLGWADLWRRERAVALAAVGTTIGVLFLYGGYDMWYGGLCWGPRFVVPLLPMLILPLASVLAHRRRAMRILGLVGLAVSTVLQVPASTASWGHAVEALPLPLDPNLPWYDMHLWHRSPALVQALHWRPEWLNLLWWHTMSDGGLARDLRLAGSLALALITVLAILVWSSLLRFTGRKATFASIIAMAAIVGLGSGLLLWRGYHLTRDYPGLSIGEAREIAATVSAKGGASETTLVSISNEFHIYFWLGLLKGRFLHYWCSPGQTEGFGPVLEPPWRSRSLWLVVDRVHLQPEHSGHDAEFWLNRYAYQADGRWIGGFEVFRYVLPDEDLPRRSVECNWTDQITLYSVGQSGERVRPGEDLLFELTFARIGEIPEDYTLFLHLFSDEGHQILGRDGQPQYGSAPTSQWRMGEQILDRRAIAVPPEAEPGDYTIVAGWVRPNGQRVPGRCGDGAMGDHIELGTVRVGP